MNIAIPYLNWISSIASQSFIIKNSRSTLVSREMLVILIYFKLKLVIKRHSLIKEISFIKEKITCDLIRRIQRKLNLKIIFRTSCFPFLFSSYRDFSNDSNFIIKLSIYYIFVLIFTFYLLFKFVPSRG